MKSRFSAVPYVVWMVIFIVVPLLLVVYFAFTTDSGGFTIGNISAAGTYSMVLFRSVLMAVIATVICLLIAYPLAYGISRLPAKRQGNMLALVMLPMWMSFLLRTYAWMTILEKNGIINNVLNFLGFGSLSMINTPGAVILGMVYNYLPFMILPLYSIMEKIDFSIIEAAQDLGANTKNVFSKIVIPLSMPGIQTGITMVFVPSISTFAISRMLGGGGNLMIGDLIEMQFIGQAYNPHIGSAISLVLMVIVLLVMSIFNQFGDDEEREGMLV